MSKKRKFTFMQIDGEKFVNEDVLDVITEKLYEKFDFSYDVEPSYHSSDPFEPSYGASVDFTGASASVSIEELKEIFKWDSSFIEKIKRFFNIRTSMDLIEEVVDNYDCYQSWESFIEELEEYIESEIPSYKITSSSARIHFNKERTAIVLDFDVSDYEFDEDEYHEAYAPDPYDEYVDRMLDEKYGF